MKTLFGCHAVVGGKMHEMTHVMTGDAALDEATRRNARDAAAAFERRHGIKVQWHEGPEPTDVAAIDVRPRERA